MALQPLKMRAKCVTPFPELKDHIRYAIETGNEIFVPTKETHDLEAVLVGSAPSVKDQINSIRSKSKNPKYKIFGIKGAHDYLIKHKIDPDFALAVDPLEKIHKENFLLNPRKKEVVYFIASQCHPTLFDALKDRHVVVWHLLTNQFLRWTKDSDCPASGHHLVPGGSTSGLRAIVLAYHMGFRKFHLYGYDSCLQGKLRKITGDTCEKDTLDLQVAGKKFVADKAMAAQANEFQDLINGFKGEATFRGYGHGLIQTLIKERYKTGSKDCLL